jgi:hypothetical protein
MKLGYKRPSNDIFVVVGSRGKIQSGSPLTSEVEYQKMKDETRIDEIKASLLVALVPLPDQWLKQAGR